MLILGDHLTGIALGFFVCYGTAEISGDAAWRVPIAIQICMSTLLAVGSPFLPHSPRWLVMHGRVADARKVLDGLMHPSAEAEKEEALAVQPRQSNQVHFILLSAFARFRHPLTSLMMTLASVIQHLSEGCLTYDALGLLASSRFRAPFIPV